MKTSHYLLMVFLFFLLSLIAFFLSSLTLNLLLLFTAFLTYLYRQLKFYKSNILSIGIVTGSALVLYSFAVPFSYIIKSQEDGFVHLASLLSNKALFSFMVGSELAARRCNIEENTNGIELSNKLLLQLGLFIIGLSVLVLVSTIEYKIGFITYLKAGYAKRAVLKRSVGPVELPLYYMCIGYALVFMSLLKKELKIFSKEKIIFYVGVFVYLAFIAMLGIRRPSFMMLAGLVGVYTYLKGQVSFWKLASVVLLSFMFFVTFSKYRQVLAKSGVYEALVYVFSNANLTWLDFSKSELGAPYRSLLTVLSSWDYSYPFAESYLHSMTNLIPRRFGFYQNSLSEDYSALFSSHYQAIGGNMGLAPIAESVIHFSFFGPVIVFFMLGYLIQRIFRTVNQNSSPLKIVFTCNLLPFMVFFFRADFAACFKVVFYSLLLPWGLIIGYLLFKKTISFPRLGQLKQYRRLFMAVFAIVFAVSATISLLKDTQYIARYKVDFNQKSLPMPQRKLIGKLQEWRSQLPNIRWSSTWKRANWSSYTLESSGLNKKELKKVLLNGLNYSLKDLQKDYPVTKLSSQDIQYSPKGEVNGQSSFSKLEIFPESTIKERLVYGFNLSFFISIVLLVLYHKKKMYDAKCLNESGIQCP